MKPVLHLSLFLLISLANSQTAYPQAAPAMHLTPSPNPPPPALLNRPNLADDNNQIFGGPNSMANMHLLDSLNKKDTCEKYVSDINNLEDLNNLLYMKLVYLTNHTGENKFSSEKPLTKTICQSPSTELLESLKNRDEADKNIHMKLSKMVQQYSPAIETSKGK